ncbi:MAG: aminotransferase class I/II-fold pyridoxal phosphate-dependent enzyme [Phycisphaerae bacterium]|nr:PLP-dependent aminotransferase family protein [Phycisphaerae bacterium]NIP51849.1 PLP-dependent aminotransferase family protein [Phycisphaerae bacterium]NIS51009.1 PLP-dependent aminotransferase family protein [Phycisphaerae bacterium]NIU07808.1 PLP-dependent aminotransferase family protein [Phycisphaerae bacterium]NIU58490.1 aminotransferase class I/II-fold pyridoxal phosphate-dependent enzyme [Phycisphaerae bacterium]
MNNIFSDRISDVPRSFIREILKVAVDTSVISFAGGLPNRDLFPVAELQAAVNKVFESAGKEVLQYSNSEGYPKLREYISRRYLEKKGLDIPVENILITSGSQQGLDLLGKTFLNEGDDVIIEEPGYLGAIQAFSVYKSVFNPVRVTEDGMDVDGLKEVISARSPKLMYSVPNFQNPSGISYSVKNRSAIADVLKSTSTLLIEDDPYGDLRFTGDEKESFGKILPEKTILLGSFSKTIVPSFRLGWITAPNNDVMEKLIIAKQASDLHTNYFIQRVICQYIADNDLQKHIDKIIKVYNSQRLAMVRSIEKYFPSGVSHTHPEGGMFLWATLPEGTSSMELFDFAIKDKVAFVPGIPFYINKEKTNTLRLNFSCVDEETIETGIKRLGKSIEKIIS